MRPGALTTSPRRFLLSWVPLDTLYIFLLLRAVGQTIDTVFNAFSSRHLALTTLGFLMHLVYAARYINDITSKVITLMGPARYSLCTPVTPCSRENTRDLL